MPSLPYLHDVLSGLHIVSKQQFYFTYQTLKGTLQMSLVTKFNNFAHAIAAGSKYFANVLIPDALKIATKAQKLEPEAEMLIGALAGPQAAALSDTIFKVFGQVANGLVPLSQDQASAVAANGLNLKLDLATVNDIKMFAALIQQLLAARGTPAPPPTPALALVPPAK